MSQVASLLKIVEAKLDAAKEAGPANLGSTVVRECLSSLNSATAILDRLEENEPMEAPPVTRKPAQPVVPAVRPARPDPPAKAPAKKKPLKVPKIGAIDVSDMEV
jgi:hypothetical protein